MGLELTDADITAFAKQYGFEQKSARLNGSQPLRRYVLDAPKLNDILERHTQGGEL